MNRKILDDFWRIDDLRVQVAVIILLERLAVTDDHAGPSQRHGQAGEA